MTPPDERPEPTADQPLNAEPRPRLAPALAVLALIVVVAVVFFVLIARR